MALMDIMMDEMIAVMKPDEKGAMLLRMMPDMMKDLDLAVAIRETAPVVGRYINATGLVRFLLKARQDDELKQVIQGLKERLIVLDWDPSALLVEMMPTMMSEMMQQMMDRCLKSDGGMKQMMPRMMMQVMPHCVATMLPLLGTEQSAFLSRLNVAVQSLSSGQKEN